MTSAASVPYAVQAASHGAQLFRQATASLLPRGVTGLTSAKGGTVAAGDFAVSAGTGNSVNIAAGQAWVGGTQTNQSMYYCFSASAVTGLAITPNGSNPLIAVVTASVNDQAYSGNPGVTNNEWDLLITQGTPAASPAIPSVPNNSLVLATIYVPASASSSASYSIVQGLATGVSGTTLTGSPGTLTVGAPAGRIYLGANQNTSTGVVTTMANWVGDWFRGGVTFTTSGNPGLIVPVTGYYSVSVSICMAWTATANNVQLSMLLNGTELRRNLMNFSSGTQTATSCDIIPVTAGQSIGAGIYQGTGSNQVAQAVYDQSWITANLVSI